VDGPYLIAHSWLFRFSPLPLQSPRFVYRHLIRGVRWLRRAKRGSDLSGGQDTS
jgi:hypothetical protein